MEQNRILLQRALAGDVESSASPPLDPGPADHAPLAVPAGDGDEVDLQLEDDGQDAFGGWNADDVGRLLPPEGAASDTDADNDSDFKASTAHDDSTIMHELDRGEFSSDDEEPPPLFAGEFRAPVSRRHRLPKFDWANNPMRRRIHAMCLRHVGGRRARPAHTQAVMEILFDPGLGPPACTPAARTSRTADHFASICTCAHARGPF